MGREADFVDRLMYALRAPIIAWPGCEDSITEEQCTKAKLHRLAMAATAKVLDEASDFEAMLYIMTSTLANPPSHTWYKIYTHLFCKFYPNQATEMFGDRIEKPEEYELTRDLRGLKQWIFKKQMQALKEKDKKEKQKVAMPQEKYEQLTLPISK